MNVAPTPAHEGEDRPPRPWDLYTRRQRRAFLFVLFLAGVCNYVDKNIIGVLLEQIKTEFQASDTLLGLLSGFAFALFYATLGIPVARWADRGDRKWIITLALAVWSAMTLLCGVAGAFWQLAAARFGVGAGEAGAIPPAQSLLADYYPPEERARALGVLMMSATVGYAVALVLGGWIAQHYGWRAAFLSVGLLGIALAPLTYQVLQEPRRLPQFAVRFDDRESAFAAIRALLAKPAYRHLLAAIVAYFVVAYGVMVFVVSFMIRVHGLTVAQAGATFGTLSAVGAVVGNLGGGALTDRLGSRDLRWIARIGGWGMIAALPVYELALYAPAIATMIPLLALSTVLLWAVVPPMYSALHVVCGSKRRAMAVAVAFFFANLIGLGLGPLITGALSDGFAAGYGSAQGLRYALMIVTTAFVPAGAFMLLAARHLRADAED